MIENAGYSYRGPLERTLLSAGELGWDGGFLVQSTRGFEAAAMGITLLSP
jgi:hypothetical protein